MTIEVLCYKHQDKIKEFFDNLEEEIYQQKLGTAIGTNFFYKTFIVRWRFFNDVFLI